jgi:hypothetical protein
MLTREQKKRRKQICTTKKNTEGEEQKNPLGVSDRNHWVQTKTTYPIRALLI